MTEVEGVGAELGVPHGSVLPIAADLYLDRDVRRNA